MRLSFTLRLSHSKSQLLNLVYCPRVKESLEQNHPVVALESTIISHGIPTTFVSLNPPLGLPYPQNIQLAKDVERILEKEGVTPATIAIIDGQPRIGLPSSLLESLGAPKNNFIKASRRDISYIVSQGLNGATTVSSTMFLANLAGLFSYLPCFILGIRLFVTGGIGGVHRFGEDSMDISADLTELQRTKVAVVCAGAKSILDIGRTLEYLETAGVPVCNISSELSAEFPAFYTRKSGYKAPLVVKSPIEAATLMNIQFGLDELGGIVFSNAIPAEHELDSTVINDAIDKAIKECVDRGISGKETTPFILKRVSEVTQGKSLGANIELVKHNSRVGAQIALEYARLKSRDNSIITPTSSKVDASFSGPLFVGVSAIDMITKLEKVSDENGWSSYLETSTPAKSQQSNGGVCRNVAESYSRSSPIANGLLISPGGTKTLDDQISKYNLEAGLHTHFISTSNSRTPLYNAILDCTGKLIVAGADMEAASHEKINYDIVQKVNMELQNRPLLVTDANLLPETIEKIVNTCDLVGIPTLFEPTSVPKAKRLFKKVRNWHYVTPNIDELYQMASIISSSSSRSRPLSEILFDEQVRVVDCHGNPTLLPLSKSIYHSVVFPTLTLVDLPNHERLLGAIIEILPCVPNLILKMGQRGILVAQTLNCADLIGDALENSGGIGGRSCSDDETETLLDTLRNLNYWSWSHSTPKSEQELHGVMFRHYLPATDVSVINVNGAGDSMVGSFVSGLINGLKHMEDRMQNINSDTSYFGDASQKVLDEVNVGKNVWMNLGWKSKHAFLFSNCGIEGRDILIDEILIKAREAAELSLTSDMPVSHLLRKSRKEKKL